MKLTDEMLQAAIMKAIEAGLLPRRACREDVDTNRELIRLVLQAALSSSRRAGSGVAMNAASWQGRSRS